LLLLLLREIVAFERRWQGHVRQDQNLWRPSVGIYRAAASGIGYDEDVIVAIAAAVCVSVIAVAAVVAVGVVGL